MGHPPALVDEHDLDYYVHDRTLGFQLDVAMPTARNRTHKHFQLDAVKVRRAQRVLQANTETETIERALDLVISEHERNRLTSQAHERFLQSGGEIRDVYGKLGK
jgi:hypothetical protein